jgi:hypothetical protein
MAQPVVVRMCADCDDGPCAGNTAEVVVSDPCSCANCKAGARWFYCDNANREIGRYMCHGFDGMLEVPHPDAVRSIVKLHPGKVFRFLDVGVKQHLRDIFPGPDKG